MVDCEVDLRVGGHYRYLLSAPDGTEYGFRGEYLELVRLAWIQCTLVFDGAPGAATRQSVAFEDLGSRTAVTGQSIFRTVKERDDHVASPTEAGLEAGMNDTYARLDELLSQPPRP